MSELATKVQARRVDDAGLNVRQPLAANLWCRGLSFHLAVLVLGLVALAPLAQVRYSFSPDEGLYGLQAEALARGDWVVVPRSSLIDPDLDFPPWRAIEVEDGLVPYDRHPAYPRLLQAAAWIAGGTEGATILVGFTSVLVMAAGAWVLGGLVRRGSERAAFWLAAASPVLLHGFVLWAHAPGAALAIWAGVAFVCVCRGGGTAAWIGLAVAVSSGVLLRSESLLLAGGLIAALAWSGLAARQHRLTIGAAAVAAAVSTTVLVERGVIAGITAAANQNLELRGSGSPRPDPGYLEGRIDGLYHTMIEGAQYSDPRAAGTQLAVVMVVAGVALLALRGRGVVTVSVVVAGVALLALRVGAIPEDPISGLLVAWPIAVAGAVGAVNLARRADSALRALVGGLVLVAIGIAATQYSSGGGVHWAGRFFTPVVPFLAVFAPHAWMPHWRIARRTWLAVLASVGAATTALGFLSIRAVRSDYRAIEDAVQRVEAPVTISPVRSLGQALWRLDRTWMTVPPRELDRALALASVAGIQRVAVVWPLSLPLEPSRWDLVAATPPIAESTLNVAVYVLEFDETN